MEISDVHVSGGPALERDVAEMLLGLLGQVTLRVSDPDLERNAELAARAQRQLSALAGRPSPAVPS